MNTYIIGDIEDSPQAFRDACECIKNHRNSRFIFLGDIYHPHTSSESIANAEAILKLLHIRIRRFFVEGVKLSKEERNRHIEMVTQVFRDLFLEKELEKYTSTDKIKFQIFKDRKYLKDSYSDSSENNNVEIDCNDKQYSSEPSGYDKKFTFGSKFYLKLQDNGSELKDLIDERSTNIQIPNDYVYSETRTLRPNIEYKIWREVQDDDDGPIFLFGNKEIDLIRDLAELSEVNVDENGTIYYVIKYFRNKRRKNLFQSLTVHEINVLLTYLSLCEDTIVLGKTLFTHIYANARQIYYRCQQVSALPQEINENTSNIENKGNTTGRNNKYMPNFSAIRAVKSELLPLYDESRSNGNQINSIAYDKESLVNYYSPVNNQIENQAVKRFIHVFVGHSKCFGSFIDSDHPELQISMLDITGDTTIDPKNNPDGTKVPPEINFKNYARFVPCFNEGTLVAHAIFNTTDPTLREMVRERLPAKYLFLTSKPCPMVSVIDFYPKWKAERANKLENRSVQTPQRKPYKTYRENCDGKYHKEPLSAYSSSMRSWRTGSHNRSSSDAIIQQENTINETSENYPVKRRSSICLAMDITSSSENQEEISSNDNLFMVSSSSSELISDEEIEEASIKTTISTMSDDTSSRSNSSHSYQSRPSSYDSIRKNNVNLFMNGHKSIEEIFTSMAPSRIFSYEDP